MDNLLASKIGLGRSAVGQKRVQVPEKPSLMESLVAQTIADSVFAPPISGSIAVVPRSRSLVEACRCGDLIAVKKSLDKGASLYDSVEMKEFPLLSETLFSAMHMAARYGHVEVLKYLYSLDNSLIHQENRPGGLKVLDFAMIGGNDVADLVRCWLDPNDSDMQMKVMCMVACVKGDLDTLKVYKEYGARGIQLLQSYENSLGQNLVHHAAYFGHLHILQWLHNISLLLYRDNENRGISHFAVLGDQAPVVRWIYLNKWEFLHKDKFGKTAADLAAERCHYPIVCFLVNTGTIEYMLETILHNAAAQGNIDVLKWILKKQKISIYTKDAWDNTALHIAALNHHTEVLQWWKEENLDIYRPGRHGMTLPQMAAWDGLLDVLKWWKVNVRPLIGDLQEGQDERQAWNAYFQQLSVDELPFISLLILRGHRHILEWLHAERLNLDVKDPHHQRTSAQWAIVTRNLDLLKWLHSIGVDLSARGRNGKTCVHYAAKHGCIQVLDWLNEKLMDFRLNTNTDQSVAHFAAKHGHISVLEWLYQIGLPLDGRDVAGRNPFHYACEKGLLHVLKWYNELQLGSLYMPTTAGEHAVHLIALSGNVDALKWHKTTHPDEFTVEDELGRNVTYWAALSGSIECMKYLKDECMLEIDSDCTFGARQFHHAAWNGHFELLAWLRDQGVDISGLASDGGTIAHFAAVKHLEALKWIHSQNLPINAPCQNGITPFVIAHLNEARDVVEWMMDYSGVPVSDQDLELLHEGFGIAGLSL